MRESISCNGHSTQLDGKCDKRSFTDAGSSPIANGVLRGAEIRLEIISTSATATEDLNRDNKNNNVDITQSTESGAYREEPNGEWLYVFCVLHITY